MQQIMTTLSRRYFSSFSLFILFIDPYSKIKKIPTQKQRCLESQTIQISHFLSVAVRNSGLYCGHHEFSRQGGRVSSVTQYIFALSYREIFQKYQSNRKFSYANTSSVRRTYLPWLLLFDSCLTCVCVGGEWQVWPGGVGGGEGQSQAITSTVNRKSEM